MTEIENIIAMCRVMSEDHQSDGWPAVQMKTITVLCDEVERLQEQCNHLVDKFKAEIEVSYAKRNNAEQERDQLKAAVALAVDAFKRYEIDVETYPTTEHVSMMRNLEGVLAARDAEVIERAAGELFSGTHQLQKTAHKRLCGYANQLRQQAEAQPVNESCELECGAYGTYCRCRADKAKEVQS